MASDESMTPYSSIHSSMQDLDVDGYPVHDYIVDDEEGGSQEGDDVHMGTQMSSLSLETWEGGAGDAKTQLSDHDGHAQGEAPGSDDNDDDNAAGGGVTWGSTDYRSLPGASTRCTHRQRAGSTRGYASESEITQGRHGRRARRKRSVRAAGNRSSSSSSSYSYSYYYYCRKSGRTRERRLDRAWEMKRCHWAGADGGPDIHSGGGGGGSSPCVVVRPSEPGAGCMWMDMEEVKACRDLGLELPCDWTVEIPPGALTAAAAADVGSGTDPSVGNWRVSSPSSDDPGEMKARLRVWAQAVALASASRLSS